MTTDGYFPNTVLLRALKILLLMTIMQMIAGSAIAADDSPDQCNWSLSPPGPGGHTLNGIWGSRQDDVYAVGDAGTILHYDGASWTTVEHGLTTVRLSGIWGSSTGVYVVGDAGTILHFDGNDWRSINHGLTNDPLEAVWGSSDNDIFVVGGVLDWENNHGTVLHFDGTDWSISDNTICCPLADVWGSSGTNVYSVGPTGLGGGHMSHYDGEGWRNVRYDIYTFRLAGIWGSGGNDIYASVGSYDPTLAGPNLLHYDGYRWSVVTHGLRVGQLNDLWGSNGNDIYAVGTDPAYVTPHVTMVIHYDGTAWQVSSLSLAQGALNGVWGSGSADVHAVGTNGIIMHYGCTWTPGSENNLYIPLMSR